MKQTDSKPRCLWLPFVPQKKEPGPGRLTWRYCLRIVLLFLMATILIVCHPCHGEDIDDELLDRSPPIISGP